jgi:hypothetical protein
MFRHFIVGLKLNATEELFSKTDEEDYWIILPMKNE